MKGVATPEAFFLLAFLSLFLSCNLRLPLQLKKGKQDAPQRAQLNAERFREFN